MNVGGERNRRFASRQGLWLSVLVLLTACAGGTRPQASEGTRPAAVTTAVVASEKMAQPLRGVVQRMQQDGLTAANVAIRQAEAYTTPLVRVDRTGRLQVVVLVTSVGPQVQAALREHHVAIEAVEETFAMIQAWVPFDRLEEVATLPFVRYIRPPSYVTRH